MTSYTTVFGGAVIQPASLGYLAIALSENITLSWPTDFQNNNKTVANIMEITPSAENLVVTMPDARNTSVGTSFLINNPSGTDFFLHTNADTLLQRIDAATIRYIWLTDNTTAAGAWTVSPFAGEGTVVTEITVESDNPNVTLVSTPDPLTAAGTITVDLARDLSDTTGLTSFGDLAVGIATRTAANTWALRQLLPGTNIAIANAFGTAASPTISLSPTLTGLTSAVIGNINISLAANTIASNAVNQPILIDTATVGTGNIQLSTAPTSFVKVGSRLAIGPTNVNVSTANSNSLTIVGSNGGGGFTSLSSPIAMTEQVNLVFPLVAPVAGQVLGTTSATQLGWSTVATIAGGTIENRIAVFENEAGSLVSSGVKLDRVTSQISLVRKLTVEELTTGRGLVITPTTSGVVLSPVAGVGTGIITIDTTGAGDGNINLITPGIVSIQSNVEINNTHALSLKGSGAFSVSLAAPTVNGANTQYNLPANAPTVSNQFFTATNTGVMINTQWTPFASKATMQDAIDTIQPVVAASVVNSPYAAKAWFLIDAVANVVREQHGCTVVYAGGAITVTFNTPFTTIYYGAQLTSANVGIGTEPAVIKYIAAPTTTVFTYATYTLANVNTPFIFNSGVFYGTQ